jgi:hypothetical protein
MVQAITFDLLLNAKKDDDGKYDVADMLPKIGIMVAKLTKASIDQKKFRAAARKEAVSEAAAVVEKAGRSAGVSPETLDIIRKEVLLMAE